MTSPAPMMRMTLIVGLALWMGISSPTHAQDQIGKITTTRSQLGKLLAPHEQKRRNGGNGAAYWQAVYKALRSSNAGSDVKSDIAAGHVGMMTYANYTIVERPVAPGLRCLDRSEPKRRSLFHFSYTMPLSKEAGKALLAFDDYAHDYNEALLTSTALGETSCRKAGQ